MLTSGPFTSHALREKTEFMGTLLSHPRVGLVLLVRTCLQLNALDAFEFDFLFFLLVTLWNISQP